VHDLGGRASAADARARQEVDAVRRRRLAVPLRPVAAAREHVAAVLRRGVSPRVRRCGGWAV
jgi:hypothetical protein